MSMQDKDMDNLFRAKLDNLEVEPSARVWKGITVELDGGKRKRSLIPLIRIAASVAVVTSVGLFFMLRNSGGNISQVANHANSKHQTIKLSAKGETETDDDNVEEVIRSKKDAEQMAAQSLTNNEVATSLNQTEQSSQQLVAKAEAQSQGKKGTVAQIASAGSSSKIKHKGTVTGGKFAGVNSSKHQSGESTNVPDDVVNENEVQKSLANQQTLAALPANDIKIIQPVVPDEPLNISKSILPGSDDFKTGNKVASVQLPAAKPAKAPVKKHGIRSFGDLINVVVAKVDKRKDKVIQFSDTDDDEATITGINLGFVKVKTDK